ncbi:MAG: hypothetical protein Q4D98_13580 [Planctomycetia bacterium]|nr:hypothetical protein [Planctomycetia bacterium]
MRRIAWVLTAVFLAGATGFAEWSPTRERSESFCGRTIDWYTHASDPAWGAENPEQKDTFVVLRPKTGDVENAPLYVVLHSAGHDVRSCLNCMREVGNHDIYRAPDGFYALMLDCRANQKTDWWWGARAKIASPQDLSPAEKRVMETVRWTIRKYKIDPNRVYLCGNSMGGSGTLGIGLRHGDVFAAIKANVPAGVTHASDRLFLPPETVPEGFSLADPPVCVDYSSQTDRWSKGHDVFFAGMKTRRYALFAYWGPFGHANNHAVIETFNDLVNTLDWTSIRRDEAYPVFVNAACDDLPPWPDCRDRASGQINGYFRWKNQTDTASRFAMKLWLGTRKSLPTSQFHPPAETSVEVSLRRLQRFSVAPGQSIRWTFGDASGTVRADETGLLVIPLTVTRKTQVLTLQQ